MDIKSIIKQMTFEEKASLCSGKNFWETQEISRLDVPSIMMTDGPHGLRKVPSEPSSGDGRSVKSTCYPTAVLTACSFDRELIEEMGEAIADEALTEGVSIVLGPGVNMKRSPLCGRNFEYFSEDPYLAGEMATSFIKGVQKKGVGTSIKHFAANNQETRRWSSDSVVDERTFREIYLPAFKKAVQEANPATVMCSYNRVNGEYASESHRLLTEILRDEWGFDGVVISDWGAVNDRVMGLKAGMDLEMPGVAEPSNDLKIINAVRSGELSECTLDLAVERILNLIKKVHVDKSAKPGSDENGGKSGFDITKHDEISRKIAAESMVLLKNKKNLLPLSTEKYPNIAFIGEFAEKPRFQGAGSSEVNPTMLTSAADAIKEYTNVSYSKGYLIDDCSNANISLQAEAVALAEKSDVCVVFAGLPPSFESEGFDRTHMKLPQGQNDLINAVGSVCDNVVVVLHLGSPVEMPWVKKVKSILCAYLGGQASGGAVCDVLFGKQNPCGKLAETFPKKLEHNPAHPFNFGQGDVTEYREGIFIGYRYYDKKKLSVRYPFGHGLSYTKFKYSNIKLSAMSIKDTDTLRVSLDVKNIGEVAGKEIVQLYVGARDCDDRVVLPSIELRDFAKIELLPNETKTVEFVLSKSAFSYYNTAINDFHVLGGVYNIMVGKSSRNIKLNKEVEVTSTVEIPMRAHINTTIRDIARIPKSDEFLKELKKICPSYARSDESAKPGTMEYMHIQAIPEMVLRQVRLMGEMKGKSNEDLQKMIDDYLN